MSMKSLEELERAFERGMQAWEQDVVLPKAHQMRQKIIREVKRETPVDTGNLRRRWSGRTKARKGDITITVSNDAEYAAAVNDGHRIVAGGKTVGKKDGHHMLEKGIAAYKNQYLQEDLADMADRLGKAMRG